MTERTLAMTGNTRRLGIEQLEERLLLAGNVTIIPLAGGVPGVTDSNTIALVGDGADNNLDITVNGAGEIVLTGLDGTTIMGAPQIVLPAALTPILANPAANIDILIALGDGNDTLTISDIDLGGDVVLSGNTGNDFISIDNSTVAGGTDITPGITDGLWITDSLPLTGFAGSGDDAVSVTNSDGESLTITTGTGDDQVEVTNDISISLFGGLTISTGAGVDNVTVRNVDPFDLLIDVGAGGATPQQVIVDGFNAPVGTYTLLGGDQDDHFIFTNAVPGTIIGNSIQTFGGNDIVEITNSIVFEVDINLGAGNDQLIGQNNTDWEGSISGGPGDDAVLLADNQFGFSQTSMSIDLGTGNDQLAMQGSTFASGLNLLQINMGSGDDYYVSGGNIFETPGFGNFDVDANGGAGYDTLVALDSQPRDQFDAPPNLSGWELIDPDFPA